MTGPVQSSLHRLNGYLQNYDSVLKSGNLWRYDLIVVGGGGRGGVGSNSVLGQSGGGGGAGGVIADADTVIAEEVFDIVIGAGGASGTPNGGNTKFGDRYLAIGGGAGSTPSSSAGGGNGGSGGGGGSGPAPIPTAGVSTVGQGHDGGAGVAAYVAGAGGGGGAASVGLPGVTGSTGHGGNGGGTINAPFRLPSPGQSYIAGGGGGAGSYEGGIGGGYHETDGDYGGGKGSDIANAGADALPGTTFGSGGGGVHNHFTGNHAPGNGYKGIVAIRYSVVYPDPVIYTNGVKYLTPDGLYKIFSWVIAGTLKFY